MSVTQTFYSLKNIDFLIFLLLHIFAVGKVMLLVTLIDHDWKVMHKLPTDKPQSLNNPAMGQIEYKIFVIVSSYMSSVFV